MTCKGRCLKALKRNVNDTKGEKQTAEMCGVSKCKPHRSEMRHLPCESETFITSKVAQNSHSPWINESQKRRPNQLATVLTKTRKATRKNNKRNGVWCRGLHIKQYTGPAYVSAAMSITALGRLTSLRPYYSL